MIAPLRPGKGEDSRQAWHCDTFVSGMTLGADKGRYDFRPMDKWWRPRRLALVVWLQSLASEYFTRPLGLLLSRAPERCKVP